MTRISDFASQQSDRSDWLELQKKFSLFQSGGKTVSTPADNPLVAANSVGYTLDLISLKGKVAVEHAVEQTLESVDSVLSEVHDQIVALKTQVQRVKNSTVDKKDYPAIAETAKSYFNNLINLANSKDYRGDYLFGGDDNLEPFKQNGAHGSVSYQSNHNTINVSIDAYLSAPINLQGESVFGEWEGPHPANNAASQANNSVFAAAKAFMDALENPALQADSAAFNTRLGEVLEGLGSAEKRVLPHISAVGNYFDQLERAADSGQERIAALNESLTVASEGDLEALGEQLQSLLTQYKAHAVIQQKINSLNLFDYLPR